MSLKSSLGTALKIFFSYAGEDKDLRDTLAKQLSGLKRQGLISDWHDGEISPGTEWQALVEKYLYLSDIILLLISPDFVASDYCYGIVMKKAIGRHERGEVRIIPILLRPTDFKDLPFAKLQYLPTNGRAVTLWKNKDAAFLSIVEGIRKVIEEFVTKLLSEPPPASSGVSSGIPTTLWKVPYRRNPLFTGRDALLAQLHATFLANETKGVSIQTLNGLGGVGKTQIVLEYACRYAKTYQAVFWISADSQGDMISDFVTIAQVLDLPEKNEPDQTLIIAAIKRWLQSHDLWLLLFDNVEDIAAVNALIPETGRGHILITTRSQATGSIAIPHEIESWDDQIGAEFLLRRAKIMPQDAPPEYVNSPEGSAAQEISRLLDGLPLALDQVGAYVEETKRNLSDYLDLYQQRRAALLSRRGKFSADHPDSVVATLSLAFENVERAHPETTELLRLCAFLHPDAIPEEIIVEGAANFSPDFQTIASDPFLLDAAIEALLEFSLVRRNPSTRTISIHRLVQDVLKDGMSQDQQHQWAEHAVLAVSHVFPDGEPSTWPRCQRYLPHAKVCVHLIEQWHMHFDEAVQLLNNVGYYLYHRAQYAEAEHLYMQALELLRQEDESLTKAQILNNMGDLSLILGRYAQSEQYFRQALNIRERMLEHTHASVAQSLNDLAGAYYHQGKHVQAEALYLQALAIREQALGPEHPDTAETLSNLALLYSDQGKYTQAESLHLRALAIREKVLGPKHVSTSQSVHNLARIYQLQKRYTEAEPLFIRSLAIREETLGPEHPRTATTLNRLGLLYDLQGKYAEAEPLLRRALQIWEKTLGPEHSQLVDSLSPLAVIYEQQERYTEAEPLYLQMIAIQTRVLGPEHLEIAAVLDKYAALLHKMGKEAEAMIYASDADAIRSKRADQEIP